ncbi:hypothetical protein EDB85DRAFT_1865286, partial [Lactarius pseudohatsudake]
DLDVGDADDAIMVSRFVEARTLFLSSSSLDEQTTLPNPNYMDGQNDVAWLVRAHMCFRFPGTPPCCLNIFDRFLSVRVVFLSKLQLVGIRCVFLGP